MRPARPSGLTVHPAVPVSGGGAGASVVTRWTGVPRRRSVLALRAANTRGTARTTTVRAATSRRREGVTPLVEREEGAASWNRPRFVAWKLWSCGTRPAAGQTFSGWPAAGPEAPEGGEFRQNLGADDPPRHRHLRLRRTRRPPPRRRLAGAGPGQPHRRAHRLQRRLRPARGH